VLGNEHLAVRWSPYGLFIRATVLPSPKWVHRDIRAVGCTMKPTKVFPAGRCLRRRRGNGRLGERPTSKLRPVELPRLARPKGCFAADDVRSIDTSSGPTGPGLHSTRPGPSVEYRASAALRHGPHPSEEPAPVGVVAVRVKVQQAPRPAGPPAPAPAAPRRRRPCPPPRPRPCGRPSLCVGPCRPRRARRNGSRGRCRRARQAPGTDPGVPAARGRGSAAAGWPNRAERAQPGLARRRGSQRPQAHARPRGIADCRLCCRGGGSHGRQGGGRGRGAGGRAPHGLTRHPGRPSRGCGLCGCAARPGQLGPVEGRVRQLPAASPACCRGGGACRRTRERRGMQGRQRRPGHA
jgi:hypothetical protein